MELIVWHERQRITHAEARERTGYERHPAVAEFAREVDELITGGDRESFVRLSLKDGLVPRVRYLAGKHRLVCFDPAAGAVLNPPVLRRAGAYELAFCVGHSIDDPSAEHIAGAVHNLSADNWFTVLNEDDDHFVQVALAGSGYLLEYKDGDHFQTPVSDPAVVIAALVAQCAGDTTWRQSLPWHPLPPAAG